MSTTLYGSTSTAALVVHWLLIELGIEHELVLLDFDAREHKAAEYLALNPAGVVPTLLIDGLVLTEAAAIALYLADRHPGANLLPPVAHEPNSKTGIKHVTGTISMARFAPGSAQADFLILLSDMPSLDADAGNDGKDPGAGFAAFGSHGGGCNDGRQESGCNCEFLHVIFLLSMSDHALWVAARPLNGVRACRFNEWIVQNVTIFLPVLFLPHSIE